MSIDNQSTLRVRTGDLDLDLFDSGIEREDAAGTKNRIVEPARFMKQTLQGLVAVVRHVALVYLEFVDVAGLAFPTFLRLVIGSADCLVLGYHRFIIAYLRPHLKQ